MTHDDIQPLLAEHALATLAPEAAARVDAHLAGCAACRVEFDELLAAVTELELAASPVHALAPRAGALDDLLAAARSTPQEASVVAPERVARDRGVPQRPAPRRRFRFGFAAVAGLAACVALGGSLVALDSRNDRITSLERRLADARGDQVPTLRGASVKRIATEGPFGDARAEVVLKKDAGVVAFNHVPAPPAGSVWQVWVVDADERITSLGVIADARAAAFLPIPPDVETKEIERFIVTAEPADGTSLEPSAEEVGRATV